MVAVDRGEGRGAPTINQDGLQDSFRSLASSFGTLRLRMRYGTVGLTFNAGSSAA
jgi:hypothetical protein